MPNPPSLSRSFFFEGGALLIILAHLSFFNSDVLFSFFHKARPYRRPKIDRIETRGYFLSILAYSGDPRSFKGHHESFNFYVLGRNIDNATIERVADYADL
jgi:hypothetical protein